MRKRETDFEKERDRLREREGQTLRKREKDFEKDRDRLRERKRQT